MKPDNMLIYYGWLNSFNSATHGWNNEKVAQELAQYKILVIGDGVQDPSHGDYANSEIIIPRIQELNPECEIFGYVSSKQQGSSRSGGEDEAADLGDFVKKAKWWDDLAVHGIFLDEYGYDFGKGRPEQNSRVSYVHSQAYANKCFVNAWKPDHALTTVNDPSYPNSNYNPDNLEHKLNSDDIYLLESFSYGPYGAGSPPALQYESKTQWYDRGNKIYEILENEDILVAGNCMLADNDVNGQSKFDFMYTSACMWGLDYFASSDNQYGASSAASKMWTRPDVEGIKEESDDILAIENDGDKYMRYFSHGKLEVDYTSGSESSSIVKY